MSTMMRGTQSINDVSFKGVADFLYLKVALPVQGTKKVKILGIQKSADFEYSSIVDGISTIINENKLTLVVPEQTDLSIDTLYSYIFR